MPSSFALHCFTEFINNWAENERDPIHRLFLQRIRLRFMVELKDRELFEAITGQDHSQSVAEMIQEASRNILQGLHYFQQIPNNAFEHPTVDYLAFRSHMNTISRFFERACNESELRHIIDRLDVNNRFFQP
ncbi:unnamed protein product [Caenorhabditis angaria]|uniref:Uncharacterized protein n=1 Tax=Caenorhabditis angaria TaxID=860376 RepID=A0A9P1N6A2_9PELO|nr:unnamed protein product [Caenorhabditis angaria]